jgi:hypothetical protein
MLVRLASLLAANEQKHVHDTAVFDGFWALKRFDEIFSSNAKKEWLLN